MTYVFKTTKIILLISAIILGTIAFAQASDVGTIITKSGDKYESTRFFVDRDYRIVTVFGDDFEKNISFTNIKAVYNSNGDDITAEILGGYYRYQKESWRSENDSYGMEGSLSEPKRGGFRTKPYNVAVRVGTNFSIPFSDYYEGIDPGIGFDGDLILAVSTEVDIRFMVSKSGMKISDEYSEPFYSIDPNVVILNQDFSVFAMRYVLAIQYHQRLTRMTGGRSYFYTYTGIGAINHKFDIDVEIWDNSSSIQYNMNTSSSETKVLINLGFGGVVLMSNRVGLDFGANLDMVFAGGDYGNVQYGYIFDLKFGLMALF